MNPALSDRVSATTMYREIRVERQQNLNGKKDRFDNLVMDTHIRVSFQFYFIFFRKASEAGFPWAAASRAGFHSICNTRHASDGLRIKFISKMKTSHAVTPDLLNQISKNSHRVCIVCELLCIPTRRCLHYNDIFLFLTTTLTFHLNKKGEHFSIGHYFYI